MFDPGIVVSIQPRWNSAFNNRLLIVAYAVECCKHAAAIRIEGVKNVMTLKETYNTLTGSHPPIIGLIKDRINELNTRITPFLEHAEWLMEAGADYVAMECSERIPVDRIGLAVKNNFSIIADVGRFEDAERAKDLGACAITTALSGYLNKKTHPFVEPDLALVKKCVTLGLPVIAEGRYRTQKHVEAAKEAGAHSVCMGDAIHEPRNITLFAKLAFDGSLKEHAKNDYLNLN